ncbi:hypothetical protein [Nonomuraea sp. NPDC049480]
MLEGHAELRRIRGAWEALHGLASEGRQSGSHDGIERIEAIAAPPTTWC